MERSELIKLAALLREREHRFNQNKIKTYFPDTGPLRRDLYPQHMAFFEMGSYVKTRCFMAANRVGKTESGGGYETVLHLTGDYPEWWKGHTFNSSIDAWAAGDTKETVRDIIQEKLLGPADAIGTGLIPAKAIADIKYRPNGNGSADYVLVKHVNGGLSRLGFKSYDQKRKSFQGTEKDLIWLDEEANTGIRAECIIRLMTTGGLLIETFTPLRGLTELVQAYLGGSDTPEEDTLIAIGGDERIKRNQDKGIVMAGWDDVPHLGANEKRRMLAECEVHLRDSRSKGIPSLGSGSIYPIPEDQILVDPFIIPSHYKKAYGFDVGWNRTAAIWGAVNPEDDTMYLYSEHYRGQAEPSIHADAIRLRGDWIHGAIDPASRGRNQKDGDKLFELYSVDNKLNIHPADNAVETGLYEVYQDLSNGKIKIFSTLQYTRSEYRIYRRDETGKIVKKDDHLMDALRYLKMTGKDLAMTRPVAVDVNNRRIRDWRTM